MIPRDTSEKYFPMKDLITLKKKGDELSPAHIKYLVRSVCDGSMEECQIGAMLMAIVLKGMSVKEMTTLTECMLDSGIKLKWPKDWKVGDKHSTGGVGDKVSLVLAPALAACGLKVPMISGRGLGYTGGTLDKLESIPGYNISLNEENIREALNCVGCCIVGQTDSIVPADRKMYAVRDVTSTVDSLPLIVGSIMSKKAAETLNGLVLDVKHGCGASCNTFEEAERLADFLVLTARSFGISCTALITNMESPLGLAVGNALEVKESLLCLRGNGPEDLRSLVIHLGGELLANCDLTKTVEEGEVAIKNSLDDGTALNTFKKMIMFQGVSEEIAEKLCGTSCDGNCLPHSKQKTKLHAESSGFIRKIDALLISKACFQLGAGKMKMSDKLNLATGIILLKKPGDEIKIGDAWIEVHHDDPLSADVEDLLRKGLCLQQEKFSAEDIIAKRIRH